MLYEPAASSPVLDSRLRSLTDGGAGATVAYSWAPSEETEAPDGVVRLPKTLTAAQLVVALEEVVSRRHPGLTVPPPVVEATPVPAEPGPDPVVARLTSREHQVLALIAGGLPNRDIAARLGLSVNSVKTYIRTAYRKVGIERRTQAVLWGLEHGLAADAGGGARAAAADPLPQGCTAQRPLPLGWGIGQRRGRQGVTRGEHGG